MKIIFICHGNICRSPMAMFIMRFISNDKKDITIISRATSNEEIGHDTYYYAKKALESHQIPYTVHSATQLTKIDCDSADLLICMDNANVLNTKRICGEENTDKVHLLMNYTTNKGEVSDPWYTRDFERCYSDINLGCRGLYEKIK